MPAQFRRIRLDVDQAGNVFAAHVEWWHNGEPYEQLVWPAAPFDDVSIALDWCLNQRPSQGVLFE